MQLGTEMSPQYLAMYDSLLAGESTYHSSDAKMLRLKLLKVAENIDLMSKKIQQLGTDNLPEGAARPRRLALQDQVCAFCRSNTSHLTRVLLTTTRCGGPR